MIMRIRASLWVSLVLMLLVTGTVFASPSQSSEDIIDPNEGWVVPDSAGFIGSQSALFTERSSGDRPYSALIQNSKLADNQVNPTCTSTTDTNCNLDEFIYYAQIPVCQNVSDMNCIESMGATDATGKDYPGSFQRYFPLKAQNQFEGNPDWHLPNGGPGSLFAIPDASGPAGNLYYVSLIMSGHGNANKSPKVSLVSITAKISPVQLQATHINLAQCGDPTGTCNKGWLKLGSADGTYFYNEAGNDGIGCVETSWDENLCAQKEAFPVGFKFYLKARLTLAPTGWLHGRMLNPDISLTQDKGVTELEVSAAPLAVPTVFKSYLWKDMPPELQSIYDPTNGRLKGHPGEGGQYRTAPSTDPNLRAWTVGPAPYEATAFTELNAWLPYVLETASAAPHYWSFRTLSQGELQDANQCFSDPSQLNGIVTTNSTVYSPGPPTFDKEAGNLNYQVAAPHFTSAGDVFLGSYDLVMRSSVARCVYGFSKAPIKATISVVSAKGSPEIATTIVNEKDGWLHLSANGFEFSSPTVAVNLSQDVPAPVAAPVAAPKTTAKRTIKCMKGKTTKVVTAIKPACPKGYTKK